MKLSESQSIRERCLKMIRESSMNVDSWEMTLLDQRHAPLLSAAQLENGEYPIISFFAGKGDWTLYTTHRLIGEASGKRSEIERSNFASTHFGNFKQDLDSPQATMAIIRAKFRLLPFLYESGYASMAPIHYFKFWSLKWPVWKATYRLENVKEA